MARAVTRTWYRIAVARRGAGPVLVAASGEHLGAAIAAAERHWDGAVAIAVEVASEGQVPLGESVGKQHIVELGESSDVATLRWPTGVLPQIGHTAELVDARRGWTIARDPKMLVIEAQTDADHLTDLFMGLIERLPAADNLEVRVLDHFEDVGITDVWLTSRVNAHKILRFLDDHDAELFGNGHLELSVYVREHRATLRLTEHKTVVWLAEGNALEAEMTRWLGELAVPRVESLVRIAAVPHFHFRPGTSRDRKKLGEQLYRQRLRRVDAVHRDTAG